MNCLHNHDCNFSCIDKVPIFKELSTTEKQAIMEKTYTKKLEKDEMIFSPLDKSSNLWIINYGKVKLTKIAPDGREQIIRILKSSDFLGELSLFNNETMTNNAFALEKSEICIINGSDIKSLINSNPNMAIKFLETYTKRIRETEALIEKIGIYNVEKRIVKTLLEDIGEENNLISLPFSKSDFASIIGTTRETLSRKLSKFQSNGWIELIGQRKIKILDKSKLEDLL